MCFTKFSILTKVSSQKSHIGKSYLIIPLYLHRFNHFSLFSENIGTERTGVIIRVVAVVNMVPNFLITDKSFLAERSNVPSQVSKCSSTSARSSSILVPKGQGNLGWSKDKSKVSKINTLFSLLRCNWLYQCCKLAKFLHQKHDQLNTFIWTKNIP